MSTATMTTYRLRVRLMYDSSSYDPRENDNLGTMVCWHRRYRLGDRNTRNETPQSVAFDVIEDELKGDYKAWLDSLPEDEESDEYTAAVRAKFEDVAVILPLYLYDHSGISMSTGSFSCPWDSGQVGFIYCARSKALNWLQLSAWDDAARKRVVEGLEAEVEEYTAFLEGQVYSFELEKLVYEFEQPAEEPDPADDSLPWQPEDSCCGFLGSDHAKSGLVDHVGEAFAEAVKTSYFANGDWVLAVIEESA